MKTPLLLLFLFLGSGNAEKFLNDVPLYSNESYFKEKVYAEHDWKSFMQLKDANEIVNPDNYDLHLLNAAVFFSTNKLRDKKKHETVSLLFHSSQCGYRSQLSNGREKFL